MRRVFLDHQSSTPVLPEVFEAMRPFFTEAFGNPASLHQLGLRAREALAQARTQVASLINAESPDDILFTSGGTEAANLAIKGVAYANQGRDNHIVLTATEHPAVANSVEFLQTQGFACTRVPVDHEGRVRPEAVVEALTEKTILICIHHANHDLGTLQPVQAIGPIAAQRGIPLFVDATTSGGWQPIDVQAMGASLLSLSPHRFYGPKGAGVLYRHRRTRLAGILHGGDQEGGRRPGTQNVPAIVGAGTAAEIARNELPGRAAHVGRLQQQLWNGLRTQIAHLKLHGPEPGPRRLPTHLSFSVEFVEGEGLALMCDLKGVAFASGTACVSQSLRASPVLAAIGIDPGLAGGAILLSLGKDNTEADIEYAGAVLAGAVTKLREMSPLWDAFRRGAIRAVAPTPGRPALSPSPVVPDRQG